jgi:hypothetical protein
MNTIRLDDFIKFLDREITSAVTELNLISEPSRRHLQKLVYTNLVDRFDSTVDHALLDNVLEEPLLSEGIKCLDQPFAEGEALRYLAGLADPKQKLVEKLGAVLRNGLLRERHAKKARRLCELMAPEETLNPPRVNPSTGKIIASFKPQNSKIPCTIQGYSDWLYSRRNAIVHGGGGVNMLGNDLIQLKNLYKCDAAKTFKLSIGSITTAATFYRDIIGLIQKTSTSRGK